MKQRHLVWTLQNVKSFERPKLNLEQYSTGAEMAADIIRCVDNDISLSEKKVGDFGCGPGILMIGAALLGAECIGYEIDEETVDLCESNITEADVEEECKVVKANVLDKDFTTEERFDAILMNPPFGTKNNEGTDLSFVQTALKFLKPNGAVYSLHKSSTLAGIRRHCASWNAVQMEVMAELRWELPKTYQHQRKQTVDIEVSLIRFRRTE